MLPLPDDLYYMPYGRPAVASVTFLNPAITGNTLTINGVIYTFGTDWGSRFSGTFTPNYVPGSSVRDLAELINGVDDQGRGSLAILPNATVFARAAGSKLLLFAREPGTAGNSYTLSTNNSAAFVVSGATFSGGSAGTGLTVTSANGTSFLIPAFDYMGFTYVGSTNNIATQVFKTGGSGGTTVATLTFAYVAAGAADNDKVSSITKT